MKRSRSNAGETLVETLAAILIVGLASALFLTLITTSSWMNQKANEGDKAIYEALSQAETGKDGEGGKVSQDATVSFGKDTITVQMTGIPDKLYAYRIDPDAGKGGAP